MVLMKKQVIKKVTKKAAKKIKAVTPKKVLKAQAVKVKLKKGDPGYYAEIGRISAAKRKLKSDYFSSMAKLSHPANNPDADLDGSHGGRKKKTDTTEG